MTRFSTTKHTAGLPTLDGWSDGIGPRSSRAIRTNGMQNSAVAAFYFCRCRDPLALIGELALIPNHRLMGESCLSTTAANTTQPQNIGSCQRAEECPHGAAGWHPVPADGAGAPTMSSLITWGR
jgi:hypothetical protein